MNQRMLILLPVVAVAVLAFSAPVHAVKAPEPDPPRAERPAEKVEPVAPAGVLQQTEWTFHKTADNMHPDGVEQQFMYFMNRARQVPPLEGVWLANITEPHVVNAVEYFGVDKSALQDQFAAIAPKPPAAFDNRLYAAAEAHSLTLIVQDAQNHDGQLEKIDDSGFEWLEVRISVYSYAYNGVHGHAGFNIDWGGPPSDSDGDGMQDRVGHRKAIMAMDGDYTNAGIAAVPENDPDTDVGPFVVSANYAKANTSHADHYNVFIVGTVYEDEDADGGYTPGEGIGGVTVTPQGGPHFAVTPPSGGYAVPVGAGNPGTYTVTFTGGGIPYPVERSVTVGAESVLVNVAFQSEDSDDDALPDSWENSYFGNLSQYPNDDPDSDTYTNVEEYLSRTNPAVADSFAAGDITRDGLVGVPDALQCLRVAGGLTSPYMYPVYDLDGDFAVGLNEAIRALKDAAGH
ncbi:MAG: hypothetical protein ACLFOY_08450 [Desulfatibacillaceae bacterium]